MKVRLHHHAATRSARVAWLLYELAPAVEVELVPTDLYAGQQYDTAYRTAYPLHAVPAIEISDGTAPPLHVTESGAIIVLLADAFPDAGLAPPAAPLSAARADYLQLIHQCGASFDLMLWQIRIHLHVLNDTERDDRTITRYCRKFATEAAPILAARLARAPYICGDDFSAADCMAAHVVMWARSYDLCDAEVFHAYLSRVSKRPAFRKAFADAREFVAQVPGDAPVRRLFTG